MNAPWRPTRALGRAALLGVVLLAFGAATGRGDLAVLAVPFLGYVAWCVATRPTVPPTVRAHLEPTLVQERGRARWRLDVDPVAGLREVLAHLPGDRYADTDPAHGQVAATVTDRRTTVPVAVDVVASRWGARRLGPAQVGAVGDLGGFTWQWPRQPVARVAALPTPGAFTARAGLPHPVGLVGQHRANRAGSGTELADIRPFRPGDRLRRIQWPVSLRTDVLHVTTTYADEDAEVRVVVDAGRDLGLRDRDAGRLTSLDVAVEAAGAIAAHYLTTGDRVGLSVLGGSQHVDVPAVGGHHQLSRILVGLARTGPSQGTLAQDRMLRAQLGRSVPPGAVVVLLTALVSPVPLAHAVRLSRSGHVVIVVDTLPPALRDQAVEAAAAVGATGIEDPRLARLVWRLRLLDREREVRRCAEAGVPVIAWHGPGSLDTVLRGVGRRRRVPRAVAR